MDEFQQQQQQFIKVLPFVYMALPTFLYTVVFSKKKDKTIYL